MHLLFSQSHHPIKNARGEDEATSENSTQANAHNNWWDGDTAK